MSHTITTLAARLATTFRKDDDTLANRVRVLADARDAALSDGKSIDALTAATVLARVQADHPGITPADDGYAVLAADDRYRVSRATIGAYGLTARLITEDMGVSLDTLTSAAVVAVFRTCNNRAGITDYRKSAVASIVAMPATERPGAVHGVFRAALDDYRDGQRNPAPKVAVPAAVEETIAPADALQVERSLTAADVAPVPASAEVIRQTITRLGEDLLAMAVSDPRAFAALADHLADTSDAVGSILAEMVIPA